MSASDMELVRKYYDTSLLKQSAPYNIPGGANLVRKEGTLELTEDEYAALFAEKQEHARKVYTTLPQTN